ncbi:hypothetical protein [Streptomyces sp. NBC_00724]|uniref:hypothetical protein n=1 Tax=Streptomyces sp. NBC_00724 TaxID=2975812 RepID=UPI002ED5ED23|nr:hypothetical protein OHB17_42395 [Streptomyces sp. NBC_00724]
MSGLAARAHYALDHGMMEIAGDDVLPCVELLHSMLKTAPDPVGIAAGKNLAYEACVGWSIAQIERQRKDYREGYTHPTIHNGLVVYYACGERTEFKDSLTLAVEVGYYAARAHVNRPGGELPGQILSELYGPTLREPS